MKRILFALHLPPPVHGASMVGKYIQDSCLINDRFDCQYINLATAESLNDIGKFGVKKLLQYLSFLYRLRKMIKKNKPDLLYITPNAAGNSFYKDFITVSLAKYWSHSDKTDDKVKLLLHFHNKGCKDFSESCFNNWLYRRFFNGVDILLLSEILFDDIKKYVAKDRCFSCGNGIPMLPRVVDDKISDNIQRKIDVQVSSPLKILFLSNMMSEKGVWSLLEACCLLKQNGVVFNCTFVGGWKDITEEAFNNYVINHNLQEEVFAVGAKYGEEKEIYWQDADVFVFPTYYHNECFPLVLLEAMQHALPCISTNEAAIPDIIDDGKTGFIIEKRNPQVLADKLLQLANDRRKCIDMGISGCNKYKRCYTIDAFEKNLYDIFMQII